MSARLPDLLRWGVWLLAACMLTPSAAHANAFLVVQPVIVGGAIDANTLTGRDELFATAIFQQAPIQLVFQNAISVPAGSGSGQLPSTLQDVTSLGFPNPDAFNTYFSSPSFQNIPVLTVWYVAGIASGKVGVSSPSGCVLCASWIAGPAENPDTLAHEIAHILTDGVAYYLPSSSDPSLSTDPHNLLAAGNRILPGSLADIYPNGPADQIVNPTQTTPMLASRFIQQSVVVPEPATVLLILSALLALGGLRAQSK